MQIQKSPAIIFTQHNNYYMEFRNLWICLRWLIAKDNNFVKLLSVIP